MQWADAEPESRAAGSETWHSDGMTMPARPPKDRDTIGFGEAPDWINPVSTESRLADYVAAVWAGRWIVVLTVALAFAGALVYVTKAEKVYEAHAQLLATPVPASPSTTGLGLIQQSSDPLRDVETFAGFVKTTPVAVRVQQSLGSNESAQGLRAKIKVAPIAESDIIDIAADASSAARAQVLADAFARAAVAERTAELYRQLDVLIPRLKAQLAALGSNDSAGRSAIADQLAQLQTLRAGADPTVRVQALADLPSSPISPRKTLTIVAAIFAGLVAGIGLVFVIQLIDPRLRREDELRQRFRLPIIARVPRKPRHGRFRGLGPITPDLVAPPASDAYRSLGGVLSRARGPERGARVVLVTGVTPRDGKTTTALNLAATLAASETAVILIEGDVGRPSIGQALNIPVSEGVEDVLSGHLNLEDSLLDAVVTTNTGSQKLRMLLATTNGGDMHPLSPGALRALLGKARGICDWIVIDAPPLMFAPELLSAAEMLDEVLLVVRLGNTNVRHLEDTAETLAQHGIRPAGFVVVGTAPHGRYYY